MDSIAPGTVIVTSIACTPPATSASTTRERTAACSRRITATIPSRSMRAVVSARDMLFGNDIQRGRELCRAARADHHVEAARLHDPLHAPVDQRELVGAEPERDGPRVPRLQRDAREAAQFLDRAGHRAHLIAD